MGHHLYLKEQVTNKLQWIGPGFPADIFTKMNETNGTPQGNLTLPQADRDRKASRRKPEARNPWKGPCVAAGPAAQSRSDKIVVKLTMDASPWGGPARLWESVFPKDGTECRHTTYAWAKYSFKVHEKSMDYKATKYKKDHEYGFKFHIVTNV